MAELAFWTYRDGHGIWAFLEGIPEARRFFHDDVMRDDALAIRRWIAEVRDHLGR